APATTVVPRSGLVSFGFAPGEQVADFAFRDVDGRTGTLTELMGRRGLVLAIRDAECPVSTRYAPRLAEMEKEWGARGFAFAYLDVTPASTARDAKRDASKYALGGRTIADADTHLAETVRAKS